VLAHDKLRGHFESFAPCGAVAGMLARCDEAAPVWAPAKNDEAVLRPGYRPTCLVTEDRRMRLATLGINTIQAVRRRANRRRCAYAGGGAATSSDWQYLAARRLALFIVNSIERGTRWVAMAQPHAEVAEMAASQVRAFFEALYEDHAFGTRRMQDAFFVRCEQRNEFQLLIGFAARATPGFHSFRIVHSASGSKIVPVSLNRLNAARFSRRNSNGSTAWRGAYPGLTKSARRLSNSATEEFRDAGSAAPADAVWPAGCRAQRAHNRSRPESRDRTRAN